MLQYRPYHFRFNLRGLFSRVQNEIAIVRRKVEDVDAIQKGVTEVADFKELFDFFTDAIKIV